MQRCSHCPYCGNGQTQGHGSFARKDGTREPRRRCRACDRTFCAQTGTATYYLKKRRGWEQMSLEMAQHWTVRRLAKRLGVRPATVFRWRHPLLGMLCREPQPILTGHVGIGDAWVRYSEKGSRRSGGPGAWGCRIRPGRFKPFRRFAEGKPSFVLVAYGDGQLRKAIVGQGRPSLTALQAAVAPMLVPGATVWTRGLALYDAGACHQLGYKTPVVQGYQERGAHPYHEANVQCGYLYGWLRLFRGVATRYLPHYLAWFRQTCQALETSLAA